MHSLGIEPLTLVLDSTCSLVYSAPQIPASFTEKLILVNNMKKCRACDSPEVEHRFGGALLINKHVFAVYHTESVKNGAQSLDS